MNKSGALRPKVQTSLQHRGVTPRGFTLLEVITTIFVILILAGLFIGVGGNLRDRGRRVQCMTNLRQLHAAAEIYLQQNGAWPQIRRTDHPDPADFADLWIDALSSSGVQRATWICPTMQQMLKNPDYSTPQTARIDYVAMPFDDKPTTAHQWPRQPWFVEVGDVHGNGNLMVFADGSIADLSSVVK